MSAAKHLQLHSSTGELGDLPSYAAGRKALDLVQQDKKADVTALLNSVQKDEAFIQKLRATYGEMTAPIKSQSLDAPAPAPAAALTPAPAPALAVAEPAAPLDMAKLPSGVMMFVGQGTQFVGMARDVIEKGGVGKGLFDRASAVLGYDLAALCLQGIQGASTCFVLQNAATHGPWGIGKFGRQTLHGDCRGCHLLVRLG